MNSLNTSGGLDLFIPIVSKKPLEFIEDMDDTTRRADTPDVFFQSTAKTRTLMNRSIFNFSYGDITQMMPEMKYEADATKEESETHKDELKTAREETSMITDNKSVSNVRTTDSIGKRARLLEKACETLNLIFTGKQLQKCDFEMPEHELNIVKCIVTKKFANNEKLTLRADVMLSKGEELVALVNELRESFQTKKRKEEKIKFVFKHTIKDLKKSFFGSHGILFVPENEPQFFSHYFHISEELNAIPLEHFYDPLNTSFIVNPCFKTLSKDFLHLLFKSPSFKADFLEFTSHRLLSQYQQKIYKKFKKLFKRLRKRIRSAGYSKISETVNEFIVKFNENKRCKLPWVHVEITDAVQCFEAHIKCLSTMD